MTESVEPAAKPLGLIARIVGMITAPRATFEGVVKDPRPVGILLVCALVIGLAQTLLQLDPRIQQSALEMQVQAIERFTGTPATPEMTDRMAQQMKTGAYFAVVGTLIVMPIICLLGAAIYWVIFNAILGGTAAFKQVLAVVTHSQVITALGVLVGAPIHYMQGTVSAGGPFNLGALVPMLADGSVIKTVLAATSVFTIWGLVVAAIGFAVLYKRKTLNIAITLFIVYGAIALFFASIFSRFMGGR